MGNLGLDGNTDAAAVVVVVVVVAGSLFVAYQLHVGFRFQSLFCDVVLSIISSFTLFTLKNRELFTLH